MKRIAIPLCLIAGAAWGQSVPAPNGKQISQGVTWTPNEWKSAWQTKQDVGGAITSGTINGVTIGGTTPAAGTFTSVNATSGFQINGGNMLRASPPYLWWNQLGSSTFAGFGAGQAFPIGSNDPFGSTGFGSRALSALTATGSENSAFGANSCEYVTTGQLNTCIGMHAGGFIATTNGNTAIGTDAMRDAVGPSTAYVVAVGQAAVAHGSPTGAPVAIGSQAGRGSSSGVLIGGSIVAGDTITVTLSASGSTPSGLTGLPASYTHTVAGGDTLASIAADIASHLNNVVNGPSLKNGAASTTLSSGQTVLWFVWPGTQTNGWAITPTVSTTGSGITGSVIPGTTIGAAVIVGNNAARGEAMQNLTNAVIVGDAAGTSLTTGAGHSVVIGTSGAAEASTAGTFTGVGSLVFANLSTGSDDTALGFWAGKALTTGSRNTLIGARVGANTLTTGNDNVVIGTSGSCDTASSSSSNTITICAGGAGVITATGGSTPSTSVTGVAGVLQVNGSFTVSSLPTCNSGAEGTWSRVTDANSTTFNAVAAGGGSSHMPVWCDGTNWRIH